jgi:hypothetical protein
MDTIAPAVTRCAAAWWESGRAVRAQLFPRPSASRAPRCPRPGEKGPGVQAERPGTARGRLGRASAVCRVRRGRAAPLAPAAPAAQPLARRHRHRAADRGLYRAVLDRCAEHRMRACLGCFGGGAPGGARGRGGRPRARARGRRAPCGPGWGRVGRGGRYIRGGGGGGAHVQGAAPARGGAIGRWGAYRQLGAADAGRTGGAGGDSREDGRARAAARRRRAAAGGRKREGASGDGGARAPRGAAAQRRAAAAQRPPMPDSVSDASLLRPSADSAVAAMCDAVSPASDSWSSYFPWSM